MSNSLLQRARRRSREILVRHVRNKKYYPLIYFSWWHCLLPGEVSETQVARYLTAVPHPGAGIGHQMANWIAGYWFAYRFGLFHAHIPFSSSNWERLLSFGESAPYAEELIQNRGYRRVHLPLFDEFNPQELERTRRIIDSYRGKKVLFVLEQDQFYRDQFGAIDRIQSVFYRSATRLNDDIRFSDKNYNIAIHVRRGDITAGQKNQNPNLLMRWQEVRYFENVLSEVLKAGKFGKPVKIYLFSQGNQEEFVHLMKLGDIEFCLDMGAQESFLHMVYADLLVTSKSSFSYKPALLSRGIKVCPRNFWHGYPEKKDWILAEEDGSLNDEAVTKLQCA